MEDQRGKGAEKGLAPGLESGRIAGGENNKKGKKKSGSQKEGTILRALQKVGDERRGRATGTRWAGEESGRSRSRTGSSDIWRGLGKGRFSHANQKRVEKLLRGRSKRKVFIGDIY